MALGVRSFPAAVIAVAASLVALRCCSALLGLLSTLPPEFFVSSARGFVCCRGPHCAPAPRYTSRTPALGSEFIVSLGLCVL